MSDYAHSWTDDQIERLDALLTELYGTTAEDMGASLDDLMSEYMAAYGEELEYRVPDHHNDRSKESGDAKGWLAGQAAVFSMVSAAVIAPLVEIAIRTERRREEIVNDMLPRIYAENYNFQWFVIDHVAEHSGNLNVRVHIDFNLMDEETAKLLLNPLFKVVPGNRATSLHEAWYRAKLRACITRGILTGQSIPNMAKSLRNVTDMGRNAAVRAARTACTHAENAGRIKSYEKARRMGIDIKKQWEATLDDRTRSSHRQVDGEIRDIHERFSNGLIEPGDYSGSPSEYYNCRCALVPVIAGVDMSDAKRWNRFEDGEVYEDWKQGKPNYSKKRS